MSENQCLVADLIVKLHFNIDHIDQIVQSLSHDSYNQELDQVTAERESAIHDLREKRVEALKEILAQRSREKEETENKRRVERKLIEEKRVQEWEEILARRKREDEEWQKTIDVEDEAIEKSRSAEDEEREREREEEERILFEKSEEELEKLEKNMEKKLEEGKIKLKELGEDRKIISAQIESTLSALSVIPNIVFRSRRPKKETASHDDSLKEFNENLEVVTPIPAPENSESILAPKEPEDYHPPVFRVHSKSVTHIREPKTGKDFSFVTAHKKSCSEEKISRYTPLLTSSEPKELRLVAIIQKEMTELAMKKNESIISQKKFAPKYAIQMHTRDAGTEIYREGVDNSLASLATSLPKDNHASILNGEALCKEDLSNLESESLLNSASESEVTESHSVPVNKNCDNTDLSTWLDSKAVSESNFETSSSENQVFDQDDLDLGCSSQSSQILDSSLELHEQCNSKVNDSILNTHVEFREKQMSSKTISDSQDSNHNLPSSIGLDIRDYPSSLKSQLSEPDDDLVRQSIQADRCTTHVEESNEELDHDPKINSPNELQNSLESKNFMPYETRRSSVSTDPEIAEDISENLSEKLSSDSALTSDKCFHSEYDLTMEELIQPNKCSGLNQDLISKTNIKSEMELTNDDSDVPNITDVSESDTISEYAHLNQSFSLEDVSVLGPDARCKFEEEDKESETGLLLDSPGFLEIQKERLDRSLNYPDSTEDLETTKNTDIESLTQLCREIQRQDSISQLSESEQVNLDKISHSQAPIDNQTITLTSIINQSSETSQMNFITYSKILTGEQVDAKKTNFTPDPSVQLEEDELSDDSSRDFTLGSEMTKSVHDAESDYSERCDKAIPVLSNEIVSIDTEGQDMITYTNVTNNQTVTTQKPTIPSIQSIEGSTFLDQASSTDSTTANLTSGNQIIETKDKKKANLSRESRNIEILDEPGLYHAQIQNENKSALMRAFDMRYKKGISRDLAALRYFNTSLIPEPYNRSNAQPSTVLGMPVSSYEESYIKSCFTMSTRKSICSDTSTEELEVLQKTISLEDLEQQNSCNQDNFDQFTDVEDKNFCSSSQVCQSSDQSMTIEISKTEKEIETTHLEDEADSFAPYLTVKNKESPQAEDNLHGVRSEIMHEESVNENESISVESSKITQDDSQSFFMRVVDINSLSYSNSMETRSISESSHLPSPTTETTLEDTDSHSYSQVKDSSTQNPSSDHTSDSKDEFGDNIVKENTNEKGYKYEADKDEISPISSKIISEAEKYPPREDTDEESQIAKCYSKKYEPSNISEIINNVENVSQSDIEDENEDSLSKPPIKDGMAEESLQTQEEVPLSISIVDENPVERSIISGFILEDSFEELKSEKSSNSPRRSINIKIELEKDSTLQEPLQDNNLEHQSNVSQNSFKEDDKIIPSLRLENRSDKGLKDSLPSSGRSDSQSTSNSSTDAVLSLEHENPVGNPVWQKNSRDSFNEEASNLESLVYTDTIISPGVHSTLIDQESDEFQDINQKNHLLEASPPITDSYPETVLPTNRTNSLSATESKNNFFQKARALFEYQQQQEQQKDQQKKNSVRPLSGLLNRRNMYKSPQNRTLSLNSTFSSITDISEDEEATFAPINSSDNNNSTHHALFNASTSAPPYSKSNKRSQRTEQSRLSFFEHLQRTSGTSPLISPNSGILSPVSCSQGSGF